MVSVAEGAMSAVIYAILFLCYVFPYRTFPGDQKVMNYQIEIGG